MTERARKFLPVFGTNLLLRIQSNLFKQSSETSDILLLRDKKINLFCV